MNKAGLHNKDLPKCHKKITIGFIFNHPFFLGGGEVSFFELIRTLDKRIFKPVVIVPASGEIERKLKNEKIEVYSISFPPIKDGLKVFPLRSFLNLIKIFKKKKIDVIHINGSRVCFYGAIVGRILKMPVIWHVRESLTDLLLYDWLLGTLSNIVICVSNSVKLKRFGRFGQRLNKKISVVYNGVDTSKFQKFNGSRCELRTRFSVGDNDILIGLVGNIIPRKAQDFFLKGFAKAKQIQPGLPVKVILIGHYLDKQFSDYLRGLVIELDLDSDVIFQEFSDEISNHFSAFDIFALSSKSEGFCRSLLEAMSSGLPIIATKISEIEEALTDNENGILVDFMDIATMASAIMTLCKSVAMRREIGLRNRLAVKKKFSLVSHTNMIECLYLNAV